MCVEASINWLSISKALAYYTMAFITAVKFFKIQAPKAEFCEQLMNELGMNCEWDRNKLLGSLNHLWTN